MRETIKYYLIKIKLTLLGVKYFETYDGIKISDPSSERWEDSKLYKFLYANGK